MNYIIFIHVIHRINQLPEEEASCVLAHSSEVLAEIEHEATVDIFHGDVDDVFDDFSRRLHNKAFCAIIDQFDNIRIIKIAKNLNFLLDVFHDSIASFQVFVFHHFDGDELGGVVD